MSEKNFINYVMNEYTRVLNEFEEYNKWFDDNPEKYGWEYPKTRPSKAELERYGILARQTMLKIEKGILE